MNKLKLILFFAFLFCFGMASAQGPRYSFPMKTKLNKGTIIVEAFFDTEKSMDSTQVRFSPAREVGLMTNNWESHKQKISDKRVKWAYDANGVTYITIPFLLMPHSNWMAEPGDSIFVTLDGKDVKFSGSAADKFTLQYEIRLMRKKMKPPTKEPIVLNPLTLSQYYEWINFLDKYEQQFTVLINSYQGRVSTSMLDRIRDQAADYEIDKLKDIFFKLTRLAKKDTLKTLSNNDICLIYDATIAPKVAQWLPYRTDGYLGSWRILKTQTARKYNFQYDKEPLNSQLKRALLYYEEGLKLFKDKPLSREQFLTRLLTEDMLDDIGYTREIRKILDKYYEEPGFREYKDYVFNYELKGKRVRSGVRAPDFALTDTQGQIYSSESLKGKIVLMDFWFTGCIGCLEMTPIFKKIEKEFDKDTNVVFLSISADIDSAKWLKSIKEKKYTTGDGINLYTNGNGTDDYMIDAFMISSYPSLYLLDKEYKIVSNPIADPRRDSGEFLIRLIRHELAKMKDGPYVMVKDDSVTVYSINQSSVSISQARKKTRHGFNVQTDDDNVFEVILKNSIKNEPSEFSKPEKLIALSDIEGNFLALRKLLQGNHVIDENYNWTFGKGHLVLNGDIFDRGEQVTECLWLIYSLEEKAKSAGGYVHVILGNHEIMNLSGDHRYARSKYHQAATIIGKTYSELYGSQSELGKWLRTKNIMERIGDLLFVHAGVSQEINNLPLTIEQINELARPYYDRDSIARRSSNSKLTLLYETESGLSPFWYRFYYLESEYKIMLDTKSNRRYTLYKSGVDQINQTLRKFGVRHIVTGHTLIGPKFVLSVHYGNKVINTDTHHASGVSEALLVEGKNYFSVDAKREKILLFID